ncbi:MAG TPA: YceI family protein [Saprospiraceae bacterium]|nr:YceI family protein [Saprospiraceae bacterium]
MKNSILLMLALAFFSACQNNPKPETAAVEATPQPDTLARTAAPDTSINGLFTITEGVVNWSGAHTLNKDGHEGTITVENGEILVSQGQVKSGKVVLDMNSIGVTDIKDPGERKDLESHLKDADFFEVNKYPKAEFVFEEALSAKGDNFNTVLNGHLTMKGKKVPLTIPVSLTLNAKSLQAESPAFPINRTQWGVNFRSGILGTTRDKMIDDTVPLILKVAAKKKD